MAELSETFKHLERDPQGGSQHLIELLETFFQPFLLVLDGVLDKRLVRTLLQCLVAIIRLRNNPQALWLSELGSYLQGYEGFSCSAPAGMQGLPHLAVTRWRTTKGVFATKLRDTEEELLRICLRKWGQLLVHVFDRGYASGPWLQVLEKYRARFVIRWIKNHLFLTMGGEEKKLWQIGQGKMYLAHKEIRDPLTGEKMPCDLWWTAVRHPSSGEQLYLVKARVKQGAMYLITNDPVKTEAQAWEIFFTYRRRWQIETSFRYAKCELALECPRLWSLEARLKLLGMVMLVYAFLLPLLDPVHHELVEALLRFKCHRTGKRCQNAQAPLYRLRWALSRLWDDYRPHLTCFLPPSSDPFAAVSLIRDLERVQKNWG